MVGLSKSRIIQHRQCPKRLWLGTYRRNLIEEDPAIQARMETGNAVGELACRPFTDGVLVDGSDLGQAVADTHQLLNQTPSRPLFEATFQAEGVLVRIDLLLPGETGYRLVEVKSSTSVKDYHLEDAAVQTWVTDQAGLRIESVEIAHIDNSFVYPGGGHYAGLLVHADITDEVMDRQSLIPDWIEQTRDTLSRQEPDIVPGPQCTSPFECPFRHYCSPELYDPDCFPPSILPYGGKLARSLTDAGYTDIRDVPGEQLSNPRHQRVWAVTRSGRPHLDPEAVEKVSALGYPRYYLDFETLAPAIPLWPGTRPYQQIPFQWSCHIEQADGRLTQTDFLAEGADDPRRAFADSMLAAIGEDGPILVYNAGFERGRILELAELYADLVPGLHAASDRLVDLLPIARDHYYHPAMRGSWSIKAVLPTIAPDLTYDDLEVGDGSMAQEAFAEMIDPATPSERAQHLRHRLLEYCARDTLAMVRIAHYIQDQT